MTTEMEAAREKAYSKAFDDGCKITTGNYFGSNTDEKTRVMFQSVWDSAIDYARGSQWVAERPDYACVFVGKRTFKGQPEYSLWEFVWHQGEGDFEAEDFRETEDTIHYYLAWTYTDGDEWDDIEECNFDEYLVIAKRPTMDEVHAETIARIKRAYTADSGQKGE